MMVQIDISPQIVDTQTEKPFSPYKERIESKRFFLETILHEYKSTMVILDYNHEHDSFHLIRIQTKDTLTEIRIKNILQNQGKLLSHS